MDSVTLPGSHSPCLLFLFWMSEMSPLFYALPMTVSDSGTKRWKRQIVKSKGDALPSVRVLGTCPMAAASTVAPPVLDGLGAGAEEKGKSVEMGNYFSPGIF